MSNTLKIYVLAIVSFLVGTSEYIISGILDTIADSLGITLAAAGQLITIFSLVYAIFTPIFMGITSSIDRRKLMVFSLGLFVIGNILAFILPGFGLFVVARVIMALGAGMVVVTALAIAAKIAPEGKQGSSIATVVMGFTASLIIGVPLGRIISSAFGWKAVFGGIALLGILAIIIIRASIPPINGDKSVPLFKQLALLKKRKVTIGLAITFFWLGGYSIAYTYLSPYLLNVSGIEEKLLSGVLLIFGVASLIGSKFGGYSTDRWGVQKTLLGGMSLHIIMLVLLSLVTNSYISVLIILILWSFAAWSSGPTQQYNLATIEPESTGILLGLNQSVMQLGMAAGAGIGGIFVEKVSLSSVTWIGALGVTIAIVATLLISRAQSFKMSVAYKTSVSRKIDLK
ncbi:MFS transporter [Heyndrickxia sporothermodurans]|uniref:MFS transporter n=1 Tax=Heyndrickxia sporothermodurans TaxID=46224 RepID=A0AB37HA57_9BACI|nr:MFS transporter [Heyndrickxia sporothermodurans]MBL5768704.1 MFS transporter [Heyndrickxia sporothermodurans]MBL5772422.1 MFS transporter [Heyndrickxia sporothermodurans]MBL5775941.1 MFS transporter [Heyndrickxia sporothermodurans]MBL5779465.1 MFS transporter [Heyndrickxia sporothermodurans]MBL5783036.1 MFS transporter [Heyndrickxia sporothermodurans]